MLYLAIPGPTELKPWLFLVDNFVYYYSVSFKGERAFASEYALRARVRDNDHPSALSRLLP